MLKQVGISDVFKNQNFLKLWIGQIFSYLGDAIVQIALMAWVINQGGKAGPEMSKILFFFVLPSFLLSPLAGIFADRFSRKTLMVFSNFARAALVFVLPVIIFGKLNVQGSDLQIFVYIFSFLMGTGSAFFYPAKQSAVPNLVKAEHLQFANALNAGSSTVAILLGAVITGLFVNKVGLANSLWINGIIYLISAGLIFLISFKDTHVSSKSTVKTGFIASRKFLYKYLFTHKNTRRVIIMSVLLTLVTASFYNTFTSASTDYYHLGIAGLSKLKLMLGIGMILGTLAVSFVSKYFRNSVIIAVSFATMFLTTATIQMITSINMAWGWLLLIGISNASITVTIDTVLQKITPDRIRGNIFGFRTTLTSLVFLSTTWIVSELAAKMSPFILFKFVSLVSLIIAAGVVLFDKKFRHLLVTTSIGSIFQTMFPIQVEGREYIASKGKIVLAGTHTGWLDTFIIQGACKRPIWYITGPTAFEMPIVRQLVKMCNVIPLQFGKGVVALDAAVNKLNGSEVVCIFPEGKLTTDGNLNKFGKGVAYIHKHSKAPIVPFVIQGGFEAWAYNKPFPKFRKVVIQFGQPMMMVDAEEKDIVNELKNRVQFMKDAMDRRVFYNINKTLHNDFLGLMQEKGDLYGPVKALSIKTKNGYEPMSYIELSRLAKSFANYLIEDVQIERGERIAILSESRPEFGIGMFASIQTGAITIPLDVKLTVSELTSILSDCNPRVLCVSSHYLDTALQVKENVKSIQHIYILDNEKPDGCNIQSVFEIKGNIEKDLGRPRSLDETALIVYTSGTTGNPKGVMISFGNIYSQLRDFETLLKINEKNTLVSILPLNHLLELNVGFFGMLYMGAKVIYIKTLSPREISNVMKETKATNMLVVPLFVKMLKNSVEKELRKQPKAAQDMFNLMYKVAKFMPLKMRRLMFKSVIDGFGGKLECFVCGGAPLDLDVGEFFERIGIPVYQGYGLTETSPTITTNYPRNNKLGSVGKALPSASIKIADNGEILATGPNVMQGYWGKPEMTAEVIDENGWFHTGDIGEIDKEGYLYITGRIKNMIVLGGGKKIFPEEVEAVIEKSELVKEVCVMSVKIQGGNKEGTEEVCAVIVPADEVIKKYPDKIELEKAITDEINAISKAGLAPYKCPTVIAIHEEDLPKTSTRKVKRKDVQEWYDKKDSKVFQN